MSFKVSSKIKPRTRARMPARTTAPAPTHARKEIANDFKIKHN